MLSGRHDLIFFDESGKASLLLDPLCFSFHGWMGKNKAWTRYDQVITVPLNKE